MDTHQKLVEAHAIENVDSINYLRQKVDVIEKSLSDVRLPISEIEEDVKTQTVGSSTEISTTLTEKIDSIRSCESILKIFTFEPREFNKKNEKCLEFWNMINSHPEIQPVNCVIMDSQNNKRDNECQTEQQESEASLWTRALYELQKKKLHHAAMATSASVCKYCKEEEDSYEVSDTDNLAELDFFDPPCTAVLGQSTTSERSSQIGDERQALKGDIISKAKEETEKGFTVEDKAENGEQDTDSALQSINEIYPVVKKGTTISITEVTSKRSTKRVTSEISQFAGHRFKPNVIDQELINNLTVAIRELAEQQDRASLKRFNSQDEQSVTDSTLISLKGIMASWGKPSNKKFRKGIRKTSSAKEIESIEETNTFVQKPGVILKDSAASARKERRKSSMKEHSNFSLNALSMLHIDVDEYCNATSEKRKKLVENALRQSYSKYAEKDNATPTTLSCPCTQELQAHTNSYCTCEPGVCKITEELETEDLAELTKYMPYGPGLDCIKLMIEGVKQIRVKNLTIEETSAEVRKLLISVQNREIQDGPCRCPLHQLDLSEIDEKLEDKRFIKNMLYESLDDALDEKYGKRVECYGKLKNKSVQIDNYEMRDHIEIPTRSTRTCITCGKASCKCYKFTTK